MKHRVVFDNQPNSWDCALPLGNGVFGCMQYYEDSILHTVMNHYEIYYNISNKVLPKDQLNYMELSDDPGAYHREVLQIAKDNEPLDHEPFCAYGSVTKEKAFDNSITPVSFYGTYPQTGKVEYEFSHDLQNAKSRFELRLEDAKTRLTLKNENTSVEAETIVGREDCIITSVKQSRRGAVKSLKISLDKCRGDATQSVEYEMVNSQTMLYRVRYASIYDKEHEFEFYGAIRLIGAQGKLEISGDEARINICEDENEFKVLTGVFTHWKYDPIRESAIQKINSFAKDIQKINHVHKEYWDNFFAKSAICIPDKFLEHAYYINQYALDCCSGKDGVMKHHACGLNGLWDIKHPNLWGSMWYWDINIQAAFSGVFTSNRLDLAKVFSDGLRCYTELSERYARNMHGMKGYSADYPYSFYYCIWPWCAQYLWFLYEYSLDEAYLRKDAYPVFIKICEFLLHVFEYDEECGYCRIYPDVSPEQGPYAHDTTATVSVTKYLFQFTLEAAEILHDNAPILKKIRDTLNKLPPYALSEKGMWGIHLKDSPDAPDNLWIRHPGVLMPLFPIGEYDVDSDKSIKNIFENTIDYLEDRCEIGIFQGSWLAAAAARLGKGTTALRMLYERGLDHMLRANGLCAEETDHFMNYCLVLREPLYYPCMMEFTGEMLAAVNEMLLQSHNGMIRVFPAIPDGVRDWSKLHRNGYPISYYMDKFRDYEAWKNVRFDKLLAKGAFEISAELKDRELAWIKVTSQKGGHVKLTSPFMKSGMKVYCEDCPIYVCYKDGVLSFDTEPGRVYMVFDAPVVPETAYLEQGYQEGILEHETYTKHKIYIGENKESRYQRQLNSFIRDWYLGNCRMQNHTVYKFDFTNNVNKSYGCLMPRQAFAAEERVLPALQFVPVSTTNYSYHVGYGFSDNSGMKLVERTGPDLLRQDFIEGYTPCEFLIEVPRGQYEVLVISGDAEECSFTNLQVENGREAAGCLISAGEYQCKVLPLVLEKDGQIKIRVYTQDGYKWKLNAVLLNSIKGY